MGGMGGMQMVDSPLLRFTWPVDGWVRGVKLRIMDKAGHPISRRLVHHINVVNFGRRQLFYPAAERIIALGQETEDIRLPATVGIPVASNMPMGLLISWHNETGESIQGATVEMTVEYSPTNLVPKPRSVLPVYMDVMYPVGQNVDFDLPAGPFQKTADFKLVVGGRIIGAGGHEHDYGTGIALQDVTEAKARTVLHLSTKLDPQGELVSVERILPGITGDGIKLQEGRTYRLTGSYNNPTGKMLSGGAMIHLAMLYIPDNLAEWPMVLASDPEYRKDIARLEARNAGGASGGAKNAGTEHDIRR